MHSDSTFSYMWIKLRATATKLNKTRLHIREKKLGWGCVQILNLLSAGTSGAKIQILRSITARKETITRVYNTSDCDHYVAFQVLFLTGCFSTFRKSSFSMAYQGPVSRKTRNFSGEIILFVSSKRKCSVSQNFAVILIFIPFTTYKKTSFTE